MRVLLTGGAGYLGSTLSRLLLDRGHQVRILDSLVFGDKSIQDLIKHPCFELQVGDIRHIEDVSSAMVGIDSVIDLAAIVGASAGAKNKDVTISTNYLATKLLAQAAISRGIRRFLFASTCSVYGANEGKELTEESPTNPLSLYAETKVKSEQALMRNNRELEPVVLRLATLCGPSTRMRFDLVLNIMTATAHFEKEVRIFGGNQWRPLLDVRDAAKAFCYFLEASSDVSHSIWNVGTEKQNLTIHELGDLVACQVDGAESIHIPEKEDIRSYKVSFNKFQELKLDQFTEVSTSIQDVEQMFLDGRVIDYKHSIYYNS